MLSLILDFVKLKVLFRCITHEFGSLNILLFFVTLQRRSETYNLSKIVKFYYYALGFSTLDEASLYLSVKNTVIGVPDCILQHYHEG